MLVEAVASSAPTTPAVSFRAARRNSTGAAYSGGVDPSRQARALKIIRLLRLTKLLRLVRFHHLLERYQDTDMYEQIMSAKLPLVFALIIFITHLCTCVWYYIGVNGGPIGWVNQLIADGVWSARTDLTTRYIWSFHSVNPKFTEIGLEDVTPSSNGEHIFAIIAELVCGLLFGRCSLSVCPSVCLSIYLSVDYGRLRLSIHTSSRCSVGILASNLSTMMTKEKQGELLYTVSTGIPCV